MIKPTTGLVQSSLHGSLLSGIEKRHLQRQAAVVSKQQSSMEVQQAQAETAAAQRDLAEALKIARQLEDKNKLLEGKLKKQQARPLEDEDSNELQSDSLKNAIDNFINTHFGEQLQSRVPDSLKVAMKKYILLIIADSLSGSRQTCYDPGVDREFGGSNSRMDIST